MVQSPIEVEFVVATSAFNQTLRLRKILNDLNLEQKESTKIFVNNQAVIVISHNLVFQGKTKHFNIKLFFTNLVFVGPKEMRSVIILLYTETCPCTFLK